MTTATQATAPPRRRRRIVLRSTLALIAITGSLGAVLLALEISSVTPFWAHEGEQVAAPSLDAADEGLQEATHELHAHINWVNWGPEDATVSPALADLADATIVLAREQGADDIAQLVEVGRDAALRDGKLMRAHNAFEDAERVVHGGELERSETYVRQLHP